MDALNPWSLLTATGALLAFLLTLYTLVGRERKSPYLIKNVFYVVCLGMLAGAVDVIAALIPESSRWPFTLVGAILLIFVFLLSFSHALRLAARFNNFSDHFRIRDLRIVRTIRDLWRTIRDGGAYEHSPSPIADDLKDEVIRILEGVAAKPEVRKDLALRSLAIAVDHQGQANRVLLSLAELFLSRRLSVQYMTASRHPIEFIHGLREKMQTAWGDAAGRTVVVDAYSPHFAFTDSIYRKKTRDLKASGALLIQSRESYAGLHSSSSKAFNELKRKNGTNTTVRLPVLVIYEDTYALTDLESVEQYRVFVRHVVPSERLWDGMFTVFVESAQSDADWQLLQSYSSLKLDLRTAKADTKPPAGG